MAYTDNDEKTSTCCCCFSKQKISNDDNFDDFSALGLGPKPEIPMPTAYNEDLPEHLTAGTVILVKGFVQPNCIRFAVNLTAGTGPDIDIPLHINPRLDRNYIVRNSRKRGRWDQEETTSAVKFNIQRNQNFNMVIFIATADFLISVNGVHFCAFTFRFPLTSCKRIQIEGFVDVNLVKYDNWSIYPALEPDIVPNVMFPAENDERTSSVLPLPYTGHLPKGFEEGWQLEISGRVKLLPHSFYINLQDGAQLWPHPIIFLHLNPRFNTSVGENVFIRNARFGGQWGPEERSRMFQFSPGSPFTIAIRRGFDRFSIWVDGQLNGEFKIGGTPSTLNTVYIQGDIIVNEIVMHKKYIDFISK